jgi:RNA recognition motif-containing protein
MDAATVYIESFPKEVTSQNMVNIFKRAGIVRYIKLPRLPDGQLKGFCFVEFSNQAEAEKACQLFNNCVPEEFVNQANPNYVSRKDHS